MFSTGFTSLNVLLLFPLSITFILTVFGSISCNTDEVLSINPSANLFVFGEFNVHHKDWITCFGGTDRPDELCYNFSHNLSPMTLLRWFTFLLRSLTVTLTVLLFWIYLFLLMLIFVLQRLSLHWEILIMLLSQFSLNFQQTQNRMPRFMA